MKEKQVYTDFRDAIKILINELLPEKSFIEILSIMCDISTEEINNIMHEKYPDVHGYSWEVY